MQLGTTIQSKIGGRNGMQLDRATCGHFGSSCPTFSGAGITDLHVFASLTASKEKKIHLRLSTVASACFSVRCVCTAE